MKYKTKKDTKPMSIFDSLKKYKTLKQERIIAKENLADVTQKLEQLLRSGDFSPEKYYSLNEKRKNLNSFLNDSNKLMRSIKTKFIKIASIVLSTLITLSGTISIASYLNKHNTHKNETDTSFYEPSKGSSQSDTISLSSPDEILKDFKERYITAYNEQYGTDFSADSIELLISKQDYLYRIVKTDQLVTHGANPSETKKIFENNNMEYQTIEGNNIKVIQILLKNGDDYTPLETYVPLFVSTRGESIKNPAVSGNLTGKEILNGLRDLIDTELILEKGNFIKLAEYAYKANEYSHINSDSWVKKYNSTVNNKDYENENEK